MPFTTDADASDEFKHERPGDRPTLQPEDTITYTNQTFRPPYTRHPDYEIRNVLFDPRWLRQRPPRLFATPDQILYSVLASSELVIYGQSPSFSAFLIEQVAPLLLLVLLGGVLLNAMTVSSVFLYGVTFVAVGAAWLLLSAKWLLKDRYTRYVLTTMRVMRIRGFMRRENAWIPLAKVTDVRYRSTPLGRLFGFAEIRIDSANEESGLKNMSNLADPETFYEKLLLIVQMKQGNLDFNAQQAPAAQEPPDPEPPLLPTPPDERPADVDVFDSEDAVGDDGLID